MSLGAAQEAQVQAEDNVVVNTFVEQINSKIGGDFEGFRVKKVCHQIVAGTNNFYHVLAYPGDVPFTITIFENLNENSEPLGKEYESKLVQVTPGHNALCLGHGK